MILSKSSFAGAAALLLLGAISQAQAAAPKDIVLDNFDSMTGWKQLTVKGEMGPLRELKSENGVGVFATNPAPLSVHQDPKWGGGLKAIDWFGDLEKDFGQTVDLNKYHYFIAKVDERSVPATLYLNGYELPIAYTTGEHVIDLRNYKAGCFQGKQHMTMRLQYLNTGGTLKLDYLKLANELTPEETKELIPPGYQLRLDKLPNDPTQGLDEVINRVDRPAQTKVAGDLLCFRDKATGAVIWRMTEQPTSSTVFSDSMQTSFNADGSAFLVFSRNGGPRLYDFQKRTWTPCPYAYVSRFSPRDPDILWCVEQTYHPGGIKFHKLNIRTGVDEVVGKIDLDLSKISSPVTDLGFASDCDMIAVGFRETPLAFVFDPTKPMAQRVRAITLPMPLKEMGLSPHGKRIFFNRCYWYQFWEMNLATGKLLPVAGAGSHAGSGAGLRLNVYAGTIIATPEGITNGTPGDATKILFNYTSGWHSDYGHLLGNGLWYVTNGSGDDMKGQAVLANVADPGTVYQVAFQNTSRNAWDNNTVVRSSPDGTKLAWTSDLWGYNAVCMAYTRQPEPPRDLTARRDGGAVVLKWNHPVMLSDRAGRAPAELLGYNIYRSNGGSLLPVNQKVVTGETFRDENPPAGVCRYVVVTEEHSGIEGVPSTEAVVLPTNMKTAPAFIHIEAELCDLTPPARSTFNGWASDWQYVRIRKELKSESQGQLLYDIKNAPAGTYTLWARCKTEGAAGKFGVTLDGAAGGDVPVSTSADSDWKWIRCAKPMELKAGKANSLILTSSDDDLCIDKMILTTDSKYVPVGLDDRFSAPPKKLEQFVASDPTTSSVHLAWQKAPEIDLDYYDIYVGEGKACPVDQAHRIASTRNLDFSDWGLKPGATYTYKVTAVNRRGQASEAASLTTVTQPVAKAVQLALTVADAKLDPRLKKESRGGVEYVTLPDQGQTHKNDSPASITWNFDLPTAGEYAIWCKYAPAEVPLSEISVGYQLDNLQKGKGVWRMRPPYREMNGPTRRNYKADLWFSDRMTMYTRHSPIVDTFKLAAGKHQLTLQLSPKNGELSHKISEVWITNDPSWRPAGWDPQANFTKGQVKRQ